MSQDDDTDFTRMIPGVKRLKQDRVNVYQHRGHKKFSPGQTRPNAVPEAPYLPQSIPSRDTHFNTGLQKKLQRKIRQGQIRPEASLDLHGYRQDGALRALEEFLDDALARRLRLVIIVHGQGYRSQSDAVLRPLVQRWLASRPQVLAWCPAQARDGAGGASYVYLRAA